MTVIDLHAPEVTTFRPVPAFPGRVIRKGHPDAAVVHAIQDALVAAGVVLPGLQDEAGTFGDATVSAVKFFQVRSNDAQGRPLKVDGVVGPVTWAALFGPAGVSAEPDSRSFPAAVIDIAAGEIGVVEDPRGSNRGRQVDEYIRAAGLDPTKGSFPWCVAFVFWCFQQAADRAERPNPMPRTAGVLDHWAKAARVAGARRIRRADAIRDPLLVRAGQVFVIDTGGGTGHSGFVEAVSGGTLQTIEGNTNDDGSRDGFGVFRRRVRNVPSVNVGFIDYRGA